MQNYFNNVLAVYYCFRKYSALRNGLRQVALDPVIHRVYYIITNKPKHPSEFLWNLTFKRRIKSHLPFAGIIRSSPYSPRFQDNG